MKNADLVTVRYYLGLRWQVPLIFVILAVFFVGAIAGVFAGLAHIIYLRREVSRLHKRTAKAPATTDSDATARIVDAV
jgi:uncharacterized integral membrane protein